MIKRIFALTLLLILPIYTVFAQDSFVNESVKPIVKLSFLDSLKTTFVDDEMTSCVDNLWMKEMTNEEVFADLYSEIKNNNFDKAVDYDLPTDLFKERLRLLDEKSPFNIEYNVGLENLVKSFLKNRKRSMERLMGISQYYFPVFEEAMAKYNVPLEIKYLALVESALNPKAVSRVGATGLWQFMFQTGKQYGLKIDSYVDERSDLLKSSDAAARYMQGMYKIFGDWELVLASYNSGAGNVTKAIRRSGGHQNYWNIKKNLPRETQGYVPAFYAYMYIFEYQKEHGIVPNKAVANHFATDTIAIKKKMSFKQIAQLLDMPEAQIEFLNPSYKTKVIPYVTNQTNFLCLPKDKVAVFTLNEDKMYAFIDYEEARREKQFVPKAKTRIIKDSISNDNIEEALAETVKTTKNVSRTKYHTVKRGDNLSDIADKYNVAMAEVKKWNKLKGSNLQAGKKLKIITEERITVIQKVKKPKENTLVASNETSVASVEKPAPKKEVVKAIKETQSVAIAAITEKPEVVAEHVVESGETLISIAKKHRLYVADLKKWNNLKDSNVKLGDKLKIKPSADIASVEEKQSETETTLYTVKKGDNISVIAKNNKVSVEDLKKWNELTSNNLKAGDQLKIEKAKEVVAEVSKKRNKYQEQQMYVVQKGDSLFSISLKNKTTVAEIKKLNDMKDENLQPGMKLKIKG